MRLLFCLSAAALALAACSPSGETDTAPAAAPAGGDDASAAAAAPQADPMPVMIEAALADASRPEEDRLLDVARHPAEVLAFAGLEHGWQVADIVPGGGYYARVLSTAVGEEGHVYAFNPSWVAEAFADGNTALGELADSRSNMTRVVAPLEGLDAAIDTPLDAVFMVLFYHDTAHSGTDRAAMNQAIYDALRPGGVYIVIDHHAPDGSGVTFVNDTHRIDAQVVRDEVMAAGFVLDGESEMLANPADDRTGSVFAPDIRRHTDRFVYRFRKPA
ncbi:class I SAM-dependent methyltransferase [Maricaulis sp.]|uniref:class I SAM-dependent methyltransferase n=1 Tax=Maricaulis sp. TaxID=1486257 RepID=UPI003A93D878